MKPLIVPCLLCLLAALLAATAAQAQPSTVKLSSKISIQFPQQPKLQENGPSSIYTLRLADSTANFLAVVSDLQKSNGLDAATLAAASLQPEFWDQAVQGFMAQMGKEAVLKKREMLNIKGYDIVQLTIERPQTDGNGINIMTVYILVDEHYSLNVAHINRSGKADETLKRTFFESLVIQ